MYKIRDSIVVSIPACHAGDRGSIPRHGVIIFKKFISIFNFFSFIIMKLYAKEEIQIRK